MGKRTGLIGALCLVMLASIWFFATPEQSDAATISSLTGTETYTTVNWKKQKKAKKYIVYKQVDNGSFSKLVTLSKKKTSYTDSNIEVGKTYTYRVASVMKGGKKKYHASQSVKIVDTYDKTKIKSLVNNNTSATLYWEKSPYASFYNIYRKTPGGSFKSIGTASGSATSYTDKKIKSGTNYIYSIRATKKLSSKTYFRGKYDGDGIKLISKSPSLDVKNSTFGTLHANVKWKAMDGATGYQVKRKVNSKSSYRTLGYTEDTSFKDVYYDTLTAAEKNKEPLTATNFYDPATNPVIYTVRAYKTVDGKTSYGSYNTQGVMLAEAPTLTGVQKHKKKGKLYAKVSFGMLKNAKEYKIYGGTHDSKGNHWTLLRTVKGAKYKYGDYTVDVKTSEKYTLYTVKAGFPMAGTTYSKYDTGFDISKRKKAYSDVNVMFFGDSITFGSPYKGKTTVRRYGYPWRVNQLTGVKWFNPSIPGATYTAKWKNGNRPDVDWNKKIDNQVRQALDPDRSRLVVEVAGKMKFGEKPWYNTTKPVSDASGKTVRENVPSYAQEKSTPKFEDFDVIIMAAGTNDWQDNAEIGEISSTNETEYYGALNIIMDDIMLASKNRVKAGKKPIKVVFTDLYYSDRRTGDYATRNNRFKTKNNKGYTLVDYQNAIDNIRAKYSGYGLETYRMATDKYVNENNAPYVMSDNLHMTRYAYGQIGNGMSEFLIKNRVLDKKYHGSDINKIKNYVSILLQPEEEEPSSEEESSSVVDETTESITDSVEPSEETEADPTDESSSEEPSL